MLRMGLCLGTEVTEEEKKARIHSAKIDRDMYEYAKREMNVVKILLLGETDDWTSSPGGYVCVSGTGLYLSVCTCTIHIYE